MNLTESQVLNLSRLTEIGTFTFVDSGRLVAPRSPTYSNPYRYENEVGYRLSRSSKGSHKGFNMTTLKNLVDMGHVICAVAHTGKPSTKDLKSIGDHTTATFTFRLA